MQNLKMEVFKLINSKNTMSDCKQVTRNTKSFVNRKVVKIQDKVFQ